MKKIAFTFFWGLLCFGVASLKAQKEGFIWLFDGGLRDTDPPDSLYATAKFDFAQSDPISQYLYEFPGFHVATSMLSDSAGNLLAFTNGTHIFNKNFAYVQGGYGLQDPVIYSDGYAFPQAVMLLPFRNNSDKNLMISGDIIIFNDPLNNYLTGGFKNLHYSISDFGQNNLEGKVLVKKNNFSNDTCEGGQIAAVQHGNGRDWWVLSRKLYTNEHQKYLTNSNSISLFEKQNIGLATYPGLGQASFSPNGEYFARYNWWGVTGTNDNLDTCGFYLYKFDRCTGELSEPLHKKYPAPARPGGVAFSPNSRFLYISHQKDIFQYDLQAADVLASEKIVAEYDGFVDDVYGLPVRFFMMGLAPNGKIYINIPNFNLPYLHVIENPDEEGVACNVKQHAIKLPIYNHYSMPNMPNYRLGRWVGSPCDTLTSPVREINISDSIKLYPNPSSGNIQIETPKELGTANLTICIWNAIGAKVLFKELLDAKTEIHCNHFPDGLYYYSINENNNIVKSGKLLKISNK